MRLRCGDDLFPVGKDDLQMLKNTVFFYGDTPAPHPLNPITGCYLLVVTNHDCRS